MRKKELPIWFKVETIVFLFFSGAIGISCFKMSQELSDVDAQYLLTKLYILIGFVLLIWLVSFVTCCCDK
ncbi:MAG: hypothetical protein KAQ63_01400 [Candidatus Moranbacteria bacterium]|nr:hypothetical protein [Candidatus Moranbacteria bacterium]